MAAADAQVVQFQRRLGLRVKARRKAMKFSQKELAFLVGYESHTMISEIENGTALPSTQKLVMIATALECTVEELLGLSCDDLRESSGRSLHDIAAMLRAVAAQLDNFAL